MTTTIPSDTVAQTLPHWDMSVVFPGLESTEFQSAFAAYKVSVDRLATRFDSLGMGETTDSDSRPNTAAKLADALGSFAQVQEEGGVISAYIYAHVATDSRNTVAQARLSELMNLSVVLNQMMTRFTAWVGLMDIDEILEVPGEAGDVLREHDYLVRRAHDEAAHLMSPAEENLAASLAPMAGSAWSRLHSDISSQLSVSVDMGEGETKMPMSAVRNLAMSADREVRRRGYQAELKAWKETALPLAAAMNSIKGETNELSRRRKWSSPLHAALFNNNIDPEILDAMMSSARASFPDFRRYLQAKATLLGVSELAWYDLFAPTPASPGKHARQWTYRDATQFIVEQFGTYSQRLSDFAARAFRENWIDAEPRSGKAGGAFCMKLRKDESRILANFVASYDGMSTLAHELGHGYHNLNLASQPVLLRTAPMTLAETASIFCQTLIKEAVLTDADRDEQIEILEASLQDQCQVTVDITSRFLFESRILERRAERELSIDEINEIMLEAQRETYGDGLDEKLLHPYMWAVKGHYYSVSRGFYNYPYMFGLLFGLGLFARYQKAPDEFRSGYDSLLASTGRGEPYMLAKEFGFDIRSRDFWDASFDIIRTDIRRFESLVGEGS
jgi:oligoendopeptidase F